MPPRVEPGEAIVLGERSGWKGGERFYLTEVAVFLHQSSTSVRKWAKRQGLIKRLPVKAMGVQNVEYFTRYAAMRVIAHFRAVQGEMHLNGKDHHHIVDRDRAWQLRNKTRLSK